MSVDQNRVQDLVARPAEGLNVEIKRWIDPDDESGVAKIVRACLALRNRNGGYVVIGFDNKTLQPDLAHEPNNVHTTGAWLGTRKGSARLCISLDQIEKQKTGTVERPVFNR